MRVCFFGAHVLPLFGLASGETFGGAEVQISFLARYFQRHGFDVDILVSSTVGREPKVVDGVRLIPATDETSRSGLTAKIRSKLKLLSGLRRSNADVFVATCAGPEVAAIGLFAQAMRRKFVYRAAHESDCDGSYERAHGIRGRLFALGMRSADVIVAQHRDQQRMLADRGLTSTLIYNSFDMSTVQDNSDRPIDALWVARAESWKRPEMFLDLAEALPNRKSVMICPRKRGQEELFESIRNRAGAIPNLTFVESVPFAESQSWFDRAKLFVGTSQAEGFPNTYIQACIAGAPIVAYEVDPEGFIERTQAGYVAGGDCGRLKEGVERLLNDRTLWEASSKNAREYARRMHDLDVQGAKWAELLRSLADPSCKT